MPFNDEYVPRGPSKIGGPRDTVMESKFDARGSALPRGFRENLQSGYNHVPSAALGAGLRPNFTPNIADSAEHMDASGQIPNFGFNREEKNTPQQTLKVPGSSSVSSRNEGSPLLAWRTTQVPRLSLGHAKGTVKDSMLRSSKAVIGDPTKNAVVGMPTEENRIPLMFAGAALLLLLFLR